MPSKNEILHKLRGAHPALAHDVAKAHNGVLYDLACKTTKCGQKISHFFVELPTNARALAQWTMTAELRVQACPKCACKGNWDWKESAPASDAQIADAQKKEEAAELARKEARAAAIDAEVVALQEERAALGLEEVEVVEAAPPEVEAEA